MLASSSPRPPRAGLSYCAHVQLAMACRNPPGLAAMFLESGGFWCASTVAAAVVIKGAEGRLMMYRGAPGAPACCSCPCIIKRPPRPVFFRRDAYQDGVRYGGAFTMKQVTWAFKVCGGRARSLRHAGPQPR